MKPQTILLICLLSIGMLASSANSQTSEPGHVDPGSQLTAMGLAEDPFAPVYIVTSQKLFRSGIDVLSRDAVGRRDSLGNDLVLARIQAHQLTDVSHMVHEREKRCGGYFAFKTRAEAEAFIKADRSMQAVTSQLVASYPIDNQSTVEPWLAQVQETGIRATINHLSTAFQNRYYASNQGRNSALWIRDNWLALAHGRSDVSAELFACVWLAGSMAAPSSLPM